MRPRRIAAALIVSVIGLAGCADSGGQHNLTGKQPTYKHGERSGAVGGARDLARGIAIALPLGKIAKQVGAQADDPRSVAEAYADQAFRPEARAAAIAGFMAGYRKRLKRGTR